MTDLRALIQASLDNRDRERTEAAAQERAERDAMMERIRRDANISMGKNRMRVLSLRFEHAKAAFERADKMVNDPRLALDGTAEHFWMHEWRVRSAELQSLNTAAEIYANEHPELADEFRALVQAVRS